MHPTTLSAPSFIRRTFRTHCWHVYTLPGELHQLAAAVKRAEALHVSLITEYLRYTRVASARLVRGVDCRGERTLLGSSSWYAHMASNLGILVTELLDQVMGRQRINASAPL